MDPLSTASAGQNAGAMMAKDVLLLKKSQDLSAQQALALIAALPESGSPPPSPSGVGKTVDFYA